MADIRRYQPRRSSNSGGGWVRWVVLIVMVIIVAVVVKSLIGSKKTPSPARTTGKAASTGIDLVTDNANSAINTAPTNAAVNGNTNSTTNTNTAVIATSGSWKNFSVTSCSAAISSAGVKKQVALTFAVSAANDQVNQVLEVLKKAAVPADFFVTGAFAEKNPAVVKTISQDGFSVYSQSYDSTDLTKLTSAGVTSAITKAEAAIISATGISPKPIFRPPSGSFTTQTVKLLNQAGYCAILWTVDAYDWQDGITAAQAQDRVMTALDKQSGGGIVALHAGYDVTPSLVTSLLSTLKTQGYTVVSLAAMLNK